MWKLISGSIIVFLGCVTQAIAQPCSPYVGAQIGASFANSSISVAGLGLDGLGSRSHTPDVGLQVGCNFRIANSPFVLGAFADYTWRDAKTTLSLGPTSISASLGNTYTVGGRVGYLLTGGAMPYALIGWTNTDIVWPTGATLSNSTKGWSYGGGIEIPLNQQFSLAGEARWTRYDAVDLSTVFPGASLKPDALQAMIRLNWNFASGLASASPPLK